MSSIAKSRLNSTWTPLGNEQFNQKNGVDTQIKTQSKSSEMMKKDPDPLRGIFEERKALVGKWFDKWTDSQRKSVLESLVNKCKTKQLKFASEVLRRVNPVFHDDFTRCLPRVLSIYIFSFLDPRSLCRAAQVCWYWKHLTEIDQLWMPKCCRLGWVISFSPSPYETGVWKRFYIEKIMALKCVTPKMGTATKDVTLKQVDKVAPVNDQARMTPRRTDDRPPWRGSDPVPTDTWRHNYLENDDELEKVQKLRRRGLHGAEADDITRKAKNKVNSGLNATRPPSAVSRSKSSPAIHGEYQQGRPDWAKSSENTGAPFMSKTTGGDTDPRKAAPPVILGKQNKYVSPIKLASQRSARDPPSTDLFPSQPWKVPQDEEYDSDVY